MRPTAFLTATMLTALMATSAAIAEPVPKDAPGFTTYVAGLLRKDSSGGAVTVKGPLTLALGELQVNLDRVYEFCRRDSPGCPNAVATYVKGAAEAYHTATAAPTKDAVRLVVRTESYARDVQGSLGADAPALQPKAFVEGLVTLPVLDSPRSVRMLNVEDNQKLGLSADEVYQLGITNLRTSLKPLKEIVKAVHAGEIGQIAGDAYDSSRLLLHDDWGSLAAAQNGILIVVAPAPDALFYLGDDSPKALDALRTLAADIARRSPRPLSSVVLRWQQTGWEIVR
jgi:uncharacterized protein YtpQ (UPF0354 family)